MNRACFSPKAERDLDGIVRFISSDNPVAGRRVRETILDLADFLAQNPELGRKIRNASARHVQIRWFVVPKFRNDLIFYQPFQETSMVVRVLGAAQDWMRFFPPANS
ncbi:MAG TPA: type II toxin-antitoxin system RelE/ParE family toxin [Candidatus Saccharimonadales bacterium]|jgi:plasmid stabilization system protein ParE|nr:type II toxin-antitoxin system RelE/ParE family toxin [Candidatus Saccharimonadales bacterium]